MLHDPTRLTDGIEASDDAINRTGTLVKCVLVFFSIRIQWILPLWILLAC
jgi:hypothetical protein